jgi:hypothetical protein
VRRVVLLLALVAIMANAKYIKVASYVNMSDAINKFSELSKECKNGTYLYKNGKRYELRVENLKKLAKIQKSFKHAKIINKHGRSSNFIEVAALYKTSSIPDMFYTLDKLDGLYVKSSGKFYEFRVDLPSKSDLEKSYHIVKSKYKDSWVKYPFASTKQAKKYIATPKPKHKPKVYHKPVEKVVAKNSNEIAKRFRRDYSKIDRNTPKVIKVNQPIIPKKDVKVNEPLIPTGIVTIAKESDEYLGNRVEIKKGKQVLLSGKILDGYTEEDIYCEK